MATSVLAQSAMAGSLCSCRQVAHPAAAFQRGSPAQLLQRRPLRTARSHSAGRPCTVTAAAAAAAPPAQQKLRIKLSAFSVELLLESVDMIKTAASETGARMSGPVPLPMRKRIYTVLRSPHVNKDSREQFERRTHFRLMDLRELSSQTVDRLMQLDLPAGVDIDVKLL